jgi:hypothetical protein
MRRRRQLLFCAAIVAVPGVLRAQTSSTWTDQGGDGLWSNAKNWQPAQIPDDGNSANNFLVDIPASAPAGPTLNFATTVLAVTVEGGVELDVATGGSLTIEGDGTVTDDGTIKLNSDDGGGPYILEFSAPAGGQSTLTGMGQLEMGAGSRLQANVGSTLTIDSAMTVSGQGLITEALVNLGTISATDNSLTVQPTTMTNNGTMQATSLGALNIIGGIITNAGQILANRGDVTISGTTINGGMIQGTADGGGISISNSNVNNASLVSPNDITLSGPSTLSGCTVIINAATISAGANIGATSCSITINGGATLGMVSSSTLGISSNSAGTLTNNGTILVNSDQTGKPTSLNLQSGNLLLTGGGSVKLNAPITANTNAAAISIASNSTLTVDSGQTVKGTGEIDFLYANDASPTALVNNGTIDANVAQGTLTFQPGSTAVEVQNNGTLKASAGILNIGPLALSQSASGTIAASGTGYVVLNDTTLLGGKIDSNGQINIGGGAGLFNETFLQDNGYISIQNGGASLYGTTVNGAEIFTNGSGVLTAVGGTLTNNGKIFVGGSSGGSLVFDNTTTSVSVGGSGAIILEGPACMITSVGPGTATIGPQQTAADHPGPWPNQCAAREQRYDFGRQPYDRELVGHS